MTIFGTVIQKPFAKPFRGTADNPLAALRGGLVLWLEPEDGVDGPLIDKVSGRTFTDIASPVYGSDGVSTYIDYESSSSQYSKADSDAALQTGSVDWAIAVWCQLESKAAGASVASKDLASNREFRMQISNPQGFMLDLVNNANMEKDANSSAVLNYAAIATGTDYCLQGWVDKSSANVVGLRVNALPSSTTSLSGFTMPSAGTAALAIGGTVFGGGGAYFDGLIRRVAMWKTLSTSAIRTLYYNGGTPLSYSQIL